MSEDEKHLELNEAIKKLQCLQVNAGQLLDKITGDKRPTEENLKEAIPSLQDILNYGPKRIESACDEINDAIEKIYAALFMKDTPVMATEGDKS